MAKQTAELEMLGFGCVSCAYAIERLARRFKGIESIRVDIAASEIRVEYDPETVDAPAVILDMVRKIGHDARIKKAPARSDGGGGVGDRTGAR